LLQGLVLSNTLMGSTSNIEVLSGVPF